MKFNVIVQLALVFVLLNSCELAMDDQVMTKKFDNDVQNNTRCAVNGYNDIRISDYSLNTPGANGTEGIRVYLTGDPYDFTIFVRVKAYDEYNNQVISAAARDYFFYPNGPYYDDQSLEEDYPIVCYEAEETGFTTRTLTYRIEGVYRLTSSAPLEGCAYSVIVDEVDGSVSKFCYDFGGGGGKDPELPEF